MPRLCANSVYILIHIHYHANMSLEIVSREALIESLLEEFGSIEIPTYKFRKLFSRDKQVFFDCEGEDTDACLEQVLHKKTHTLFVVFLLIRDKESGNLKVMDVRFHNIGKETLEHFINRYHSQLKFSSIMGLKASGKEYVKYVGCSYEK